MRQHKISVLSTSIYHGARLATTLHAAATSSKVAIDRPFKLLLGRCMETLPLANAKAAGVGLAAMVGAQNHLPAIPLGTKPSIHLMCVVCQATSACVSAYTAVGTLQSTSPTGVPSGVGNTAITVSACQSNPELTVFSAFTLVFYAPKSMGCWPNELWRPGQSSTRSLGQGSHVPSEPYAVRFISWPNYIQNSANPRAHPYPCTKHLKLWT